MKDNWNVPEAKDIGGKLETVKKVILVEWMFISYLMGMKQVGDNEVNESSRLIRLFLTFLHDHEMSMSIKKKTWLSSYNFICLLNLPEQIKFLGPIRNRWEGGVRGEGFLCVVKPMVAGTGRANWQRNLLVNLVKYKSMLLLSSHPDNSQDDNKLDLSSIKVYQCMTKFIQCWAEYVAISIIIGNGVEAEGQCPPIYVLYREGNSCSVL